MKAFSFFDAYALRARLFPALIASGAAIFALAVVVPWHRLSLVHAIASAAAPFLLFAMADLARHIGRRLEPQLYAKWGGKPTVACLRYSDQTLDAPTKRRYLDFMSKKIGAPAPTAAAEKQNPSRADAYYERCGTWLRENTRDTNRFNILFDENVTYGFRRNLYGLRWPALAIDALVFIVAAAYFFSSRPRKRTCFQTRHGWGAAVIHGLYTTFAITEASVRDAANVYARQLLLSCEALADHNK